MTVKNLTDADYELYIEWNEYTKEGIAIERTPAWNAIGIAKHCGAMKGFFYPSDEVALDDFRIIHWGWYARYPKDDRR